MYLIMIANQNIAQNPGAAEKLSDRADED